MRVRAIRRNEHSPRVEMLPLIDVVFLLLTFFIYSLVMMHYLHVVPVTLAGQIGPDMDVDQPIYEMTIDRLGRVLLDDQPLTEAQFDARRRLMADERPRPRVFVILEDRSEADRGPVLMRLQTRLSEAGVNYAFVYRGEQPPGAEPAP